jgi:hypothetical protein
MFDLSNMVRINNLAKLGDGRGKNPTVMVGDKKNKNGRNRGIPKTQLGFSPDQQ